MWISWLTFIGVLGLSTFVRAQTATATLGGTVLDETGAVVANVQIAVVNLGNGLQRALTSGDRGSFVISLLPPGRYHLSARHDGFNATEIPELVLNVGDDLDIKVLLKVMLAGLWTPVAGSLVAVLGLYRAVSQPDDLWTNILLATIGIALALLGPGAWSIDAWLFGWKRIDVRDQLKK
jgi:hypothetical protein